jgi:hypothetical protein
MLISADQIMAICENLRDQREIEIAGLCLYKHIKVMIEFIERTTFVIISKKHF